MSKGIDCLLGKAGDAINRLGLSDYYQSLKKSGLAEDEIKAKLSESIKGMSSATQNLMRRNKEAMQNLSVRLTENFVKKGRTKEALDQTLKEVFYQRMSGGIAQNIENESATIGRILLRNIGDLIVDNNGAPTTNSLLDAVYSGSGRLKKLNDTIIQMYADNGVSVKNLDNYFPNAHDRTKLRAVTESEFVRDARNLFDWENMTHKHSKDPIKPNEIDDVAKSVYAGLTGKRVSDGQTLKSRIENERFIIFANKDTWKAYHKKYGKFGDDAVQTLRDHLDRTGKNIAVLRTLGGDPNRTKEFMKKVAAQLNSSIVSGKKVSSKKFTSDIKSFFGDGVDNIDAFSKLLYKKMSKGEGSIGGFVDAAASETGIDLSKINRAELIRQASETMNTGKGFEAQQISDRIDELYNLTVGSVSAPEGRSATAYQIASAGGRAAMLGKLPLKVYVGNKATKTSAKVLWGMVDSYGLKEPFELLMGVIKSDRRNASKLLGRMGYVTDRFRSDIGVSARMMMDGRTGTNLRVSRAEDTFYRATFTTQMDSIDVADAQLGFMSFLRKNKDNGFEKLPGSFRGKLQDLGVTADDWDVFRASAVDNETLGILDIAETMDVNYGTKDGKKAFDAAVKMSNVMNVFDKTAVIRSSAETAFNLGKGQPRTKAWDDVRDGITNTFLSFPVTFFNAQIRPALNGMMHKGKVGQFSAMFATLLAYKALEIQLLEMANGKDPFEFTDTDLWARALIQNEMLSFPGQLASSQAQGFEPLSSPLLGVGNQAFNMIWNVGAAGAYYSSGDDEQGAKALAKAARSASKLTPTANLPFVGVYQGMGVDAIHENLDPIGFRRRKNRELNRENRLKEN